MAAFQLMTEMVLGLQAWPLEASDQTNLSDPPRSTNGRLLHNFFHPSRLYDQVGRTPGRSQNGSRPIGLTPGLFSAYRPDPWGPVIKLTCQILLTHPVADFCTLGFTPSPIGPRRMHPRVWPRRFSASRPDPWGPVIKLTCQILFTHPVADFYTLGFAP